MIRLAAIEIALFLSPFLVFALILAARRRTLSTELFRSEAPIVGLSIVGLILVAAAMLGLVAFGGGKPEGVYVPDRFENGVLIPGQFR
ncbi:hypothetical protein EYW49_11785 [Siculibacillus lacustris]|uniref:Uncharacterized protein n=1 Tax=Siculibacillus lacustris TaxID=1549641 RepID=A0A4Q9VRC4_9HYPH|nr:DUF6111 family protein [Siculibacillus lacustris]TBW37429.1 hypothetical protein EYW49_11785 [Siculibacillus lacustris]